MNRFDFSEFVADFASKGIYTFYDLEFLNGLDTDRYIKDKVQANDAVKLTARLKLKYFFPTKVNLMYDFGSDKGHGNIEKWHNDCNYVFDGHNATINYFLDDMNEKSGGRFDFCENAEHLRGTKEDVEDMISVYPKTGMFIVFKQRPGYLHKITPAKKRRRMLSTAMSFKYF